MSAPDPGGIIESDGANIRYCHANGNLPNLMGQLAISLCGRDLIGALLNTGKLLTRGLLSSEITATCVGLDVRGLNLELFTYTDILAVMNIYA